MESDKKKFKRAKMDILYGLKLSRSIEDIIILIKRKLKELNV
ncbi:MAG: hypothetical protein ACTSPQ_12975 [Candidatus Helarchaeota archaeon]